MVIINDLKNKLRTISAIPVTPFDESGGVDYEALRRHLDFLVDNGMKVVVPCGNTGEFLSLGNAECEELISVTCQHLCDKATVVAGVSHDLDTACAMARHAADQGCAAVMVHNPPHAFLNGPGYVNYVRTIADAVDIGVVPYIRSANVPDVAIVETACIENVVGIKFAVNDIQRFASVVTQASTETDISWICGTAEAWAPYFYSAGASGFTSGLVNVAPKLSLALLSALESGQTQTVRQLMTIIQPFEDLRALNGSANNVSVVKEAMQQLSLGSRKVRPPITELNQSDRDHVKRIIAKWRPYLSGTNSE